jgi:hypothetical protein
VKEKAKKVEELVYAEDRQNRRRGVRRRDVVKREG